MRIILEIVKDTLRNIAYFIESNLRSFAKILNFALPYAMYMLGQRTYKIKLNEELLIPIVVFIMIYLVNSYANKIGKGITIPVPDKRFTEVDDDGEVSIENKRIQELLLYTADLEDWLERKGML